MSSKFTPENEFSRSSTNFIISLASCVRMQTEVAFTPARDLNNTAFPSITGMAASAPILPKPSTAEPSDKMATGFLASPCVTRVSTTPQKLSRRAMASISLPKTSEKLGKTQPAERVGIIFSLSNA
jgi:hypothetical protein